VPGYPILFQDKAGNNLTGFTGFSGFLKNNLVNPVNPVYKFFIDLFVLTSTLAAK
jgi:hypothetical protein